MPSFPFMVDISNKRCLIIGGGKVALHKVKVLLPFGVDITVLADACEPELIEFLGAEKCRACHLSLEELKLLNSPDGPTAVFVAASDDSGDESVQVEEGDASARMAIEQNGLYIFDTEAQQADFVILATNDAELNHLLATILRQHRIPVNAVDQPEDCDFYFPAMVRRDDLVIGISSSGKSPAAVRDLKKIIDEAVPDYYGKLLKNMGQYRNLVRSRVEDAESRKRIFERLLAYGMAHDGEIPEEVVETLISKNL